MSVCVVGDKFAPEVPGKESVCWLCGDKFDEHHVVWVWSGYPAVGEGELDLLCAHATCVAQRADAIKSDIDRCVKFSPLLDFKGRTAEER